MTETNPGPAAYPPGLAWALDPPRHTLADHVTRCAANYGAREFLDYRGTIISFAEFAAQVDRVAAGLLRDGLRPGNKVALYLPNSPYHPLSFFGVIKAGGVVVHLSPLDAPRELIHKITDSGARLLITTNIGPMLAMAQKILAECHVDRVIVGDDALYGPLPAPMQPAIPDAAGITLFSTLLGAPLPATWQALHPDDLAVLQYTGGTTGMPKGAMHTHATLLAAAAIYDQFYLGQSAGDEATPQRVIAVLPFFHIYALCVLLLWQMQRGSLLFLHLRFEPNAILHDIEVKRATYFPGVPTMWIALNAIPGIETRDFSTLRQVASGGAPLPLEVAERFERLVGTRIGGGWGMTETAAAGTAHLMHGAFKPASVGVPLPGFAVRIVALDDPARVLGVDETGEICVRGPNVFTGYWRNPEATAKDFVDGWFLTGDIGRLDADGMMYILDRKKDMIISGGFNVYPTMIEAAIYEHADVAECIVIGIPDAYRGQAAKAFIKLRDGAAEFSLETLNAFLADKIGRHELPAALEFRAELPKTPVGKLSKKELIAEAAMRPAEKKYG